MAPPREISPITTRRVAGPHDALPETARQMEDLLAKESELSAVQAHALECGSCHSAYEAARLSALVLKSRAQVTIEPSPFFQTRVMAALREQHSELFAGVRYRIVEPFAVLRQRQQGMLRQFVAKTEWAESLEEIAPCRIGGRRPFDVSSVITGLTAGSSIESG